MFCTGKCSWTAVYDAVVIKLLYSGICFGSIVLIVQIVLLWCGFSRAETLIYFISYFMSEFIPGSRVNISSGGEKVVDFESKTDSILQ